MRTSTTRKAERGFTVVEMVIALLAATAVLGAATRLLGATTELTRESHAHTQAEAEHRRNMAYVAAVLRTLATASLDPDEWVEQVVQQPDGGTMTALVAKLPFTFRRTIGADLKQYLQTDVQRIEWRPSPFPVAGIARPGALWLVDPAGDEVLAARVPQGGLQVRREGNVLAVRLTTFYAAATNHVAQVTSETAVSLRN